VWTRQGRELGAGMPLSNAGLGANMPPIQLRVGRSHVLTQHRIGCQGRYNLILNHDFQLLKRVDLPK